MRFLERALGRRGQAGRKEQEGKEYTLLDWVYTSPPGETDEEFGRKVALVFEVYLEKHISQNRASVRRAFDYLMNDPDRPTFDIQDRTDFIVDKKNRTIRFRSHSGRGGTPKDLNEQTTATLNRLLGKV